MTGNPYSGLLDIMDWRAGRLLSEGAVVGTVQNTNPLVVELQDLPLDADDLRVNADIPTLSAGDDVLLIPGQDAQTYYLICRLGASK